MGDDDDAKRTQQMPIEVLKPLFALDMNTAWSEVFPMRTRQQGRIGKMPALHVFLLLFLMLLPPMASLALHPPVTRTSRLQMAGGGFSKKLQNQVVDDWSSRVDSDFFDATDRNDLRYSAMPSDALMGIESSLRWIPAFIPILAYVMYDPTAECFALILESMANNNFVVVDGGQYQAKIIAPAINGVVVPGMSLSCLFACLFVD